MDAKHTPGPWETDERDHDCPYQDISIRQAGKKHVHNICRIWIDDAPVPDYNCEQKANARLIAAAPELLEALQRALSDSGCDGDLCMHFWHDKARAAIVAATGT